MPLRDRGTIIFGVLIELGIIPNRRKGCLLSWVRFRDVEFTILKRFHQLHSYDDHRCLVAILIDKMHWLSVAVLHGFGLFASDFCSFHVAIVPLR